MKCNCVLQITSICLLCSAGVLFPFNEDKATDNEVDQNSAIVGGKSDIHTIFFSYTLLFSLILYFLMQQHACERLTSLK